jgi:hypothetical protein
MPPGGDRELVARTDQVASSDPAPTTLSSPQARAALGAGRWSTRGALATAMPVRAANLLAGPAPGPSKRTLSRRVPFNPA